ncbi:hypothetical protein JQ628_15695 [Bradyrhizobium lablabi]|uniref:hypothetical protein n=1 Tax=Bradyrhizobium lablabi TaxID=722472 RepID=UPI001BA6DB98|nr:hypothetical protein [Bradyrhizobium lablabi]MBR1122970.1 hypothetical protein [Bradyrhizobium lablabi]
MESRKETRLIGLSLAGAYVVCWPRQVSLARHRANALPGRDYNTDGTVATFSLAGAFEAEFSNVTQSYAGLRRQGRRALFVVKT